MSFKVLRGSLEGFRSTIPVGSKGAAINPDLSSDIKIYPSKGIIEKKKVGRTLQKTEREYAALAIWHRILEEYNQRNQDYKINSPKPLAIHQHNDGTPSLFMEYLIGFETKDSANPIFDGVKRNKVVRNQARDSFMRHLGRLIKIKDIENMVHGDFQARHVLFSPTFGEGQDRLSVIDVENSYIAKDQLNRALLIHEQGKMLQQTLKYNGFCLKIRNPETRKKEFKFVKVGRAAVNSMLEGYNSVAVKKPIIEDVVKELAQELGMKLSFDSRPSYKKVERFISQRYSAISA